MRHLLLLALLLLNATLSFTQTPNPHFPNQIIIGFSDDSNQADRQQLINQLGTPLGGVISGPNGSTIFNQVVLILVTDYPVLVDGVSYLNEIDLISTIQGQHAKVDHADLNYEITTEQYSYNSFLGANGLDEYSPISPTCEASYPGGPLDGDADPSESRIRVGVLDTGLDPYYPTINQYVAGEVNVLTDDTNPEAGIMIAEGYDPANPIAPDDNGHGTAVAGIIAGLSDRANLSSTNLQLYIIKCFDDQGNASMFNLLQAIRVAKLLELDVLNLSWSYLTVKEDEFTIALEYALDAYSKEESGIIVAGAGNDSTDLTIEPYAPASLDYIDNLITVGGVVGEDRFCNGSLAMFSNSGSPVDIAAPGASITAPGLDGYWALNASGTSFATPIVTAAVIQSWLANPQLTDFVVPGTVHPIVEKVQNTATYVPNLDYNGIEGAVNFTAACDDQGVLYRQAGARADELLPPKHLAEAKGNMEVLPNPFDQYLSIALLGASDQLVVAELFTMQGERVMVQPLQAMSTGHASLNVPATLPSGPYLLRLSQNGVVSSKIVVKN